MHQVIQGCLDLFHHPTFRHLYHRTNEELLSWAQFRDLPMPEGFSSGEIWRLLSALRRMESHVFPFRPYTHEQQPDETWCSLDNQIGVMLKELVSLAAEDQGAALVHHRYQFLHVLSEDIAAAAFRDGIDLNPEKVHRIVTQQALPETAEEQVASNAADAILSAGKFARYPFTPWMVDDFVAHLDAPSSLNDKADAARRRLYAYSSQSDTELIDATFSTVNDTSADLGIRLLDLTSVSTMLWDLAPFPRWNSLIEVFLRNWALERWELPLLRFVAFSRLGLLWDQRMANDTYDDRFEVNPDIGEAHDATSFFGNVIDVFLKELHDQLIIMHTQNESEPPLPMEDDGSLNVRQRDTLRNLFANPTQRATIQQHMSLYGVSYGTARTDLLALAEKGLLQQTYAGRAMVFTAKPLQ